jgi:hypothetical protein
MLSYDENWVPEHDGKCDCGCGEHSVWTIVKLDNGKRRWFLTREHLHRWEAEREAQKQRVYAAFPFLSDPCYLACLGMGVRYEDDPLADRD